MAKPVLASKPAAKPAVQPQPAKSTVMVPRAPQAIVQEEVPDYLEKGSLGNEAVEQSDIALPRLALCQSNTPQRKRDDATYIKGLEEGDFFNTISREIYGPKVKLIPILFTKQRIKFIPQDEGGGIDCRSFNGKTGGRYSPESCDSCKFSQFTNDDGESQKPECLLFHNRLSWLFSAYREGSWTERGDLLVSSLKSTSLSESKNWVSLAKFTGRNLFAKPYLLESVSMTKGGNQFYGVKVDYDKETKWVSQPLYHQLGEYFESMRDKNLVVDVTGEGAENEAESFDTAAM